MLVPLDDAPSLDIPPVVVNLLQEYADVFPTDLPPGLPPLRGIHYFRSKTHVWGGFAQFRCRTSPIPKTGVGCIKARVFATGTIYSFFAMNMPNPLL
jgi:hypothetical protein